MISAKVVPIPSSIDDGYPPSLPRGDRPVHHAAHEGHPLHLPGEPHGRRLRQAGDGHPAGAVRALRPVPHLRRGLPGVHLRRARALHLRPRPARASRSTPSSSTRSPSASPPAARASARIVSRNRGVMELVDKFAQARLCPPDGGAARGGRRLQDGPVATSPRSATSTAGAATRSWRASRRSPARCSTCPRAPSTSWHGCPSPTPRTSAGSSWQSFTRQGRTVMLTPGAGFYSTPDKGRDEVRIAYVLESATIARVGRHHRAGRSTPTGRPESPTGSAARGLGQLVERRDGVVGGHVHDGIGAPLVRNAVAAPAAAPAAMSNT